MRLHQRLARVAASQAERPALRAGPEVLGYRELWRRARVLAGRLRAGGAEAGDRLAIAGENGPGVVVAFWAALAAGMVAVVLNRRLAADELAEVLADCQPAALVAAPELVADLEAGGFQAGGTKVYRLDDEALLEGAAVEPAAGDDREPAVIVYTSGSSGRPKGVCLSHRNLWTVVRTNIAQTPISETDRYLMVVPLHYVHGLLQLLSHHLAGAAIHLAGEFLFPVQLVRQMAEEEVTGFSGVPLHVAQVIERGGFLEAELPHLRWLTVTGGKCPREHLERILAARPGLRVFIAYGQTECSPRATLLDPERLARKLESVGAPIPGVTVEVVGADGEPLPAGEVGEVVVAGENVMLGYWRRPEATREVIDERGRLHTGDLGTFDEEGDLFLKGRLSSMIKTGGERIFAERVERAVAEHPEVREVVVVGVPDPLLGERVEAHVVLTEPPAGAAEAEVRRRELHRHAVERLPFAHAPKAYRFWLELPHKSHGKVDRPAIVAGEGGRPWREDGDG